MTQNAPQTYTPGPWAFDGDYIEADGVMIAGVEPADGYDFDTDAERKQAEAECEGNGYLMAAAPDMYEALRALLAAEGQRGMELGEWESAIDKARAAVAKAEVRS